MISVIKQMHAYQFEFWGGALELMENATQVQRDEVYNRIEVELSFDPMGETEINDFVWFECDDIFFGDDEEED